MIALFLILIALILFGLAAFNVPSRFGLIAAGLFFWCLGDHLGHFHA